MQKRCHNQSPLSQQSFCDCTLCVDNCHVDSSTVFILHQFTCDVQNTHQTTQIIHIYSADVVWIYCSIWIHDVLYCQA